MRRSLGYFVVIRLLILLLTTTVIVSLDVDDFSDRFRRTVDDVLGVQQFQAHLGQLRYNFVTQAPNGQIFVKMVAEDVSREVVKCADAVRRIKNSIVESFEQEEKQARPKCCKPNVNFTVDPRFPGEITRELCYIGKKPETPPKVTGVSDRTFNTMKRNLELVPSLKWQYFGNEYGTLYVYPGFPGCNLDTYDPRIRPWYGLTATYPKDMVIMIDKSHPMRDHFGDDKRMYFAIKAAKAVIDSLNPYDNIGVIAFADDVEYPSDPCYHDGLALATTANLEKLSKFIVSIHTSLYRANFSNAFTEAFRLLATTSNDSDSTTTNRKRSKVIILLSAGEPSKAESSTVINQAIIAGKQLAGQVIILAFGLDTGQKSATFLTVVSDRFVALNNPDKHEIERKISGYYHYFTKPSNDQNVVFSVPYNDTGGLGMITSACLTVFTLGNFQGVTCIDIPLDSLFSPIIDFRLAQLSYAFLIDSRGRVLLHPLLPKPETYKQHPIFLDMESVEISKDTPAIKRQMISGVAGNMSTERLKIFPRRGDSPLEGVGFSRESATYFWHPISVMNASVAVVVVKDEKNNSFSWKTNFPSVLLADELTVNGDQQDKCNNFGRVATRDKSAVKLSLQSVKNPYFYREQGLSSRSTAALKSDLEGENKNVQGSLVVKTGIREAVALTHKLEQIWKRSAADMSNSNHSGQLGNFVVYRYVGTREGVYRVYPAERVPVKYDPTKQPQYRRSEVQSRRITLYTRTDASGFVMTSFTKAFKDPSNTVVLGVIGADIMFAPLFNYLRTNFDPCKTNECFAIDRSGFVVIHKDFLNNPPRSQVHVTTKEPQVAADLVQKGTMRNDSCVSYADITNQLFWEIELSHNRRLTNVHIYAITGLDLFVVVKYTTSQATGTCVCPLPRGGSDKTECTPGEQCQCPCYTSTDYSYCSGHFTITDTTKTCYPATLPLYLPDLTSEERDTAQSLPSCLPITAFNSQGECTLHGYCYSADKCTTCPTDDTGSSSCGRVCLGLVIGLILAVLVIAVVVVVVIVARRRGYHAPGLRSPDTAFTAVGGSSSGTLNTTIISVNSSNSYQGDPGYAQLDSELPADEPNPEYLHPGSILKSANPDDAQ